MTYNYTNYTSTVGTHNKINFKENVCRFINDLCIPNKQKLLSRKVNLQIIKIRNE